MLRRVRTHGSVAGNGRGLPPHDPSPVPVALKSSGDVGRRGIRAIVDLSNTLRRARDHGAVTAARSLGADGPGTGARLTRVGASSPGTVQSFSRYGIAPDGPPRLAVVVLSRP